MPLAPSKGRIAAICAAAAGLTLLRIAPSQAFPTWITGSATASAHDKAIAHDLAYRAAIRKADSTCYGSHGGVSEVKVTYDYVSASDEWHVFVAIRENCNLDDGRD